MKRKEKLSWIEENSNNEFKNEAQLKKRKKIPEKSLKRKNMDRFNENG
ncbi:MAG: hypothetical protein Q8830_03495 [Candidatus Phytoplasma australasiaticum]|nr:hypothetical protein [Candidatus Phytoplasma australasiaticum]